MMADAQVEFKGLDCLRLEAGGDGYPGRGGDPQDSGERADLLPLKEEVRGYGALGDKADTPAAG